MLEVAVAFNRVCYRHETRFIRWESKFPVCERCGDETAPIWWVVNHEGQHIGWGHVDYAGALFAEGQKPRQDELGNLPLGLGCVLPSGRKATVWQRRPVRQWVDGVRVRIGTDVEIFIEGERVGASMWLRASLMVTPLPEYSPHKSARRVRARKKKAKEQKAVA